VCQGFSHSMWLLTRFEVRQDPTQTNTARWVWGCFGLEPGELVQIQVHQSLPTAALSLNQDR
jgi:hypothetical protein